MKTTQEILEESKALRLGITKPEAVAIIPTQLPWLYYFGQCLGAVGSSFTDLVMNFYYDELPMGPPHMWPQDRTTIVHGHSRDKFCAANTLCHILGYKGCADFTAVQQKQWEKFGYGD